MSTEENKAVVRRFLEEVMNNHDLEAIEEFITSSGYVFHASFGDVNGKEGFKQLAAGFITAIPDIYYTIEDLIAEFDKVVSRYTFGGTQKGEFLGISPTGKRFNVTGIGIDRIAGGKIVESWDIWDILSMMQQLGVIPSPPQP